MRKLLCGIITVIFVIALCGCAKKAEPISINTNFSADCNIEYDKFKSQMFISRLGSGGWEMSFSSPETINGLAVTYENENTNLSYKGLAFSIPREDIPINAIVTNITAVFDNVSNKNNAEFAKKNGIVTACGRIDSGNYTIKFNEKDGSPLSLEIKQIDLKVEFKDYKIMQ